MIHSIHALVIRNGNLVRPAMAHPETVARYLTQVRDIAEYQVSYRLHGRPHRVTGDGFLALYEAGRITVAPIE